MAVFETLFILTGLFVGLVSRGGMYLFLLPLAIVALVLAIMNRPSPTGSKAKKIVSSILSVAYLVAVVVCLLPAPQKEPTAALQPTVALQAQDNKDLSVLEKKVDKVYSMLADMKAEYSLIGKDDLERVKAEIAIHDDELIECDPTKEKGFVFEGGGNFRVGAVKIPVIGIIPEFVFDAPLVFIRLTVKGPIPSGGRIQEEHRIRTQELSQ